MHASHYHLFFWLSAFFSGTAVHQLCALHDTQSPAAQAQDFVRYKGTYQQKNDEINDLLEDIQTTKEKLERTGIKNPLLPINKKIIYQHILIEALHKLLKRTKKYQTHVQNSFLNTIAMSSEEWNALQKEDFEQLPASTRQAILKALHTAVDNLAHNIYGLVDDFFNVHIRQDVINQLKTAQTDADLQKANSAFPLRFPRGQEEFLEELSLPLPSELSLQPPSLSPPASLDTELGEREKVKVTEQQIQTLQLPASSHQTFPSLLEQLGGELQQLLHRIHAAV